MKTTKPVVLGLVFIGFSACQKANDSSQISLTPSTTLTTIGQTVSVTLNGNANASNWTVYTFLHGYKSVWSYYQQGKLLHIQPGRGLFYFSARPQYCL